MSQSSGTVRPNSGAQETSPIERLKIRSDFLRVAATRRRWATPGLVLQVAETPRDRRKEGTIRIGYTASRKVGSAVERNRARRRLREAVRRVMPEHAATGRDFVVIARASTVRRPFEELVGDLETALKKLDVWRDANAQSKADAVQ